jgi:nitrogen regulatory protein P-II 1
MKKIEAIINDNKLGEIKNRLIDQGIGGMTVSEVFGFGCQRGHPEMKIGREYLDHFANKLKVEVIVPDKMADSVVDIIATSARTGRTGDGKIFVSTIDDAVRIRTGEKGEQAILLATSP